MDFNPTNNIDPDHNLHLTSHSHHFNTPHGAAPAQFVSPYRHHGVSPMTDHSLEVSSARGLHPAVNILPHDVSANAAAQHVPHAYYQEPQRPTMTPSTPSTNASPRFSNITPNQQQSRAVPQFTTPSDRSLPSREVNDDSIADAYATFILYCNPSFPLDTNTVELKRAFRNPPKSEGKSFNIYSLFELLRRFDAKEIKTWTELALELGVERPDVEKGQSTQKVQQYTVRLKRWMRAFHIDAFFEYLLGKNPFYCRQIPPIEAPFPDQRDGVPLEEDLALRALDPKFRPKRGRRKADDLDEDVEPSSAVEPKRPHIDTSVAAFGGMHAYPQSAHPTSAMGMSAHPDDLMSGVDPWAAAAAGLAQAGQLKNVRWRAGSEDPRTPHPMSAITPISSHPPDSAFDQEPQSAVTPSGSKTKSRRRHGPAVSSAWPSSSTTPNGRLRGRPPSNRSVRDGPYVTFPANPQKDETTIDITRNKDSPEQGRPVPVAQPTQAPTPISATTSQPLPVAPTQTRPEKLQLQVPQHVGGPVHLITPTLLVNGEMSPPQQQQYLTPASAASFSTTTSLRSGTAGLSMFTPDSSIAGSSSVDPSEPTFLTPKSAAQSLHSRTGSLPSAQSRPPTSTSISNDDLKRALAADLLRGDISGRGGKRLRGIEAKQLAESLLSRLRSSPAQHHLQQTASRPSSSPSTPQASSASNAIYAAFLGLFPARAAASGLALTSSSKKIAIQRYRVGHDGYDSPIDADDDDDADADADNDQRDGAQLRDPAAASKQAHHDAAIQPAQHRSEIRESIDVGWTVTLGGLNAAFSIKGLGFAGGADGGPEDESRTAANLDAPKAGAASTAGQNDEATTLLAWRQRCLAAEKRLRETREEVGRLKERVLDAVL